MPTERSLIAANAAIDKLQREIRQANRLRNLALGVAIVCLACAGFSVTYAINSGASLDNQIDANHRQIGITRASTCASARSTSLAFREPQISSAGIPETPAHFRDRMVAQRALLRAAGNLDCASIPGFLDFPIERRAALVELREILEQ